MELSGNYVMHVVMFVWLCTCMVVCKHFCLYVCICEYETILRYFVIINFRVKHSFVYLIRCLEHPAVCVVSKAILAMFILPQILLCVSVKTSYRSVIIQCSEKLKLLGSRDGIIQATTVQCIMSIVSRYSNTSPPKSIRSSSVYMITS